MFNDADAWKRTPESGDGRVDKRNPAHVYRLSSGHGWSDGMVQTLSGL